MQYLYLLLNLLVLPVLSKLSTIDLSDQIFYKMTEAIERLRSSGIYIYIHTPYGLSNRREEAGYVLILCSVM